MPSTTARARRRAPPPSRKRASARSTPTRRIARSRSTAGSGSRGSTTCISGSSGRAGTRSRSATRRTTATASPRSTAIEQPCGQTYRVRNPSAPVELGGAAGLRGETNLSPRLRWVRHRPGWTADAVVEDPGRRAREVEAARVAGTAATVGTVVPPEIDDAWPDVSDRARGVEAVVEGAARPLDHAETRAAVVAGVAPGDRVLPALQVEAPEPVSVGEARDEDVAIAVEREAVALEREPESGVVGRDVTGDDGAREVVARRPQWVPDVEARARAVPGDRVLNDLAVAVRRDAGAEPVHRAVHDRDAGTSDANPGAHARSLNRSRTLAVEGEGAVRGAAP